MKHHVDFGRTAADYVAYRRPFPPELFDRLARFDIGIPGQRVLDVGSGTGLLGWAFAQRGCHVVMADLSMALLERSRDARADAHAWHVAARGELLPFEDESFDAVAAGQCWHWLDRTAAPREIGRVLKRDGRLGIVYQMYLPIAGSVAEASERLILRYSPRWPHANSTGISGQALRDLQSGGFSGIESFSFDCLHEYSHEEWRGLIRTTSAVGASLSAEDLERFDREHAAMLEAYPPALRVLHRVFVAVGKR